MKDYESFKKHLEKSFREWKKQNIGKDSLFLTLNDTHKKMILNYLKNEIK